MATYTCTCGTRYKLPDGSGGKLARCAKCGQTFTVPAEPDTIPVAPPDAAYHGYFPTRGTPPPTGGDMSEPDQSATLAEANRRVAAGRAAAEDARPRRGFAADVVWTFLLFTDPASLAVLLVITVVFVVIAALRMVCLGWLFLPLFYGWLFAYWFNVIAEAAAGEDSLPRMGSLSDVLDDIIFPLFRFIGATAVAASPFIIYSITARLLDIPVSTNPPGPPELITLGLSMFLWPMVMLVVAIGGFAALANVGLILATIGRTFLPYLAICLLVAGTGVLQDRADLLAANLFAGPGGRLPVFFVAALLQAYSSLVSMRIVGLYYHHFKRRFAWSWG